MTDSTPPSSPLTLPEALTSQQSRRRQSKSSVSASWLQQHLLHEKEFLFSLAPRLRTPLLSSVERDREPSVSRSDLTGFPTEATPNALPSAPLHSGPDFSSEWTHSPLRLWLAQDALSRAADPRRFPFGVQTPPGLGVALSGWNASTQQQARAWTQHGRDQLMALALEQVLFLAAEASPRRDTIFVAPATPAHSDLQTWGSPALQGRIERLIFLSEHSPRFAQNLLVAAARLQAEAQASPQHFFALFQEQGALAALWTLAMQSFREAKGFSPKGTTTFSSDASKQDRPPRGRSTSAQSSPKTPKTSISTTPLRRPGVLRERSRNRLAWAAPHSSALLETQWWGQLALEQWGEAPAERFLIAAATREAHGQTPRQNQAWDTLPVALRLTRPWQAPSEELVELRTLHWPEKVPNPPSETDKTSFLPRQEHSRQQWGGERSWGYTLWTAGIEQGGLARLEPADLPLVLDVMEAKDLPLSPFLTLAHWVSEHAPHSPLQTPWAWLFLSARLMAHREPIEKIDCALELTARFSPRPLHAEFPRRAPVPPGASWIVAGPRFSFPGSRLSLRVPSLPLLVLSLAREDYLDRFLHHGGHLPGARSFWNHVARLREQTQSHSLARLSETSLTPMLSLWQKHQLMAALPPSPLPVAHDASSVPLAMSPEAKAPPSTAVESASTSSTVRRARRV